MITRRIFMSAISAMASASLFDKLHAQSSQTDELADFHQGLTNRYPRVPHLSTEDLAALSPSQVKLFDVRKQVEYDVSHLNAAIRISPGMRASAFLDKYQHQLPGKKVVFYCSVGERSSKLAQAVIDRLGNSDLDIFNLEGGIFKWHNEGRVVFNTNGPTDKIHPFNKFWGRLLARRDQISQN